MRRRGARAVVLLVVGLAAAAGSWNLMVRETPLRAAARDYLANARVKRHREVLLAAAAESGVDAYLLAAVMVAESSGRVDARSSKDALGLFQLSRVTAEWRAQKLGLPEPTEEQLLSDALLNARLGADNMAWLLDTYDGDVERALVAYNLGTRRLANYTRAAGGWEVWRAEREAAGDSQLLAYAARVLRYRERFRERGLLEEAPVEGARNAER